MIGDIDALFLQLLTAEVQIENIITNYSKIVWDEINLRNHIEQIKQSLTQCRKELKQKYNIAKFQRMYVSTNIAINLENKKLCDKTKKEIVKQTNIYTIGQQNEIYKINFCNKICQNDFKEVGLYEDFMKLADTTKIDEEIKVEYSEFPMNGDVKDSFNSVDDVFIDDDHDSFFKNTDSDDYKENDIGKVNGEPILSCETCKKECRGEKVLKRHLLTHNPKKRISCDACNKTFSYSSTLTNHIKKGRCSKGIILSKVKQFKCGICYCCFRTEESLKKHKETYVHVKSTCEQCGKIFYHKKLFDRHKRSHTDERPFSCDICDATFKWKYSVRLHKSSVHQEKHISCDICGKVMKNERYLKTHMAVHSKDKAFSCEICGKTFRWSNGLLKHKRYHSDDTPYSCDICGKSFKEKTTLQNHKIIHNKDQYFKCDLCSRTFSFLSALTRHGHRVHKIAKK